MARNKTIFKEDILRAAEQFIIEKSPNELTARGLSKYMNISTQPLYAEFENMAALKRELFSQIYYKLQNEVFNKKTHDDPIINLCLNYINLLVRIQNYLEPFIWKNTAKIITPSMNFLTIFSGHSSKMIRPILNYQKQKSILS